MGKKKIKDARYKEYSTMRQTASLICLFMITMTILGIYTFISYLIDFFKIKREEYHNGIPLIFFYLGLV